MRNSSSRMHLTILIAGVVVTGLTSLFSNPRASERGGPMLAGVRVDSVVRAALSRACQDCHSNATRFPWYSRIAPVSSLIRRDVSAGRQHLDLSRWDEYSKVRRERLLSEIANQVEDREMPLRSYLWMHPGARLSDEEVRAIFRWTQAERIRLIVESSDPGAGK
jgi:hypothetical protein